MIDSHEAAAMWGVAENLAYSPEDRLACALKALEFFGADALAETPEDHVAAVRRATDGLNEALMGYDPDDWRDAVRLLDRLRQATRVLGALDSSVSTWVYLHGEHGLHQQVEGVAGPVDITRGREKDRWEGEAAVKDYVEKKLEATGYEVPDPLEVLAWVLEVVPVTASVALRKTPLRAAGLDVADYYTSEPGTIKVGTPSTT